MEINVINLKNEPVEKLEIPEIISGAVANPSLVHELVREYQANARQGTAATKTRGLVSGSGRKLWKQKGTGRARIGSLRSPLWRHGGTVFGPQPRDYSYSVPAKKRVAALRGVLAQKLKENSVYIVDDINLEDGRTKTALELIKSLQLTSDTLFVDSTRNTKLQQSIRNLQGMKFSSVAAFNIVDALKFKTLVISKPAFAQLTKMLEK